MFLEQFSIFTFVLLGIAACLAGLIDAIVGGGGLIQLPALFSALPNTLSATVLGTNKLAGMMGTGAATWRFIRKIKPIWYVAIPAAITALIFSWIGAFAVTYIPTNTVRAALPVVLIALAIYTFIKKDLGTTHAPLVISKRSIAFAILTGCLLGFYDGAFGPGTGSFLIFIFVRIFGFDFLSAASTSKIVNMATSLSAFIWFAATGHVIWLLGIFMAVCNIVGSVCGAYLAMRYGSSFVRKLFLAIVILLILKTAHDSWF